MDYIEGKNFAYFWIIKMERSKLGWSDTFLLRQGKTEHQKGAERHEKFLAGDLYIVVELGAHEFHTTCQSLKYL